MFSVGVGSYFYQNRNFYIVSVLDISMVFKKGFTPSHKIDVDIDLMKKFYFEDKRDYNWIANYFGLKSKSCIYDRFKKLGLKARNNTDLKTNTKHSEETKKKISLAGIGKKHSDEFKRKLSLRVKGKNNPGYGLFGNKNPHYKNGSSVYRTKYIRHHKKMICEKCDSIKYIHIHHIDFNRNNNLLSNLQALCAKCHMIIHKGESNNISRNKLTGKFQPK